MNGLSDSKSTYLRQHADDAVNWLTWGEHAFALANEKQLPVFLVIGYSSCHWCHVMAQESFRDARIAQLLNESFISVLADREERPDVDAVYMKACTAVNKSGGWPLMVIASPKMEPFYAGTYMPPYSRDGRTGLYELLVSVRDAWQVNARGLCRTGADVAAYVSSTVTYAPAPANEAFLTGALEQLKSSYDEEYGGFGKDIKFPSPQNLLFLNRYAHHSANREAAAMRDKTLKQMYYGGICDHIAGGFFRYSTDREWLVPHFEKPLGDNALLALAYIEAWQNGRLPIYRTVAEGTLDMILRDLSSAGGGYFTALDSDCRGGEGLHCLLTPEDVAAVLGEDEGRHFCECYDITPEGNFRGRSIPNLLLNTRRDLLPEGYDDYRERLRLRREEQLPVVADNKICCGLNAALLLALASAAAAFDDRRYLAAARELSAFLRQTFVREDGVAAVLMEERVSGTACVEDVALLALGELALYRADFDPEHLTAAQSLARLIVRDYTDPKGGFFKTAAHAEPLFLRPKEIFDSALPGGNSLCAVLFSRLFRYTAEPVWRNRRDDLLDFLYTNCGKYPAGCAFALDALMDRLYSTTEVVCACAEGDERPELLKSLTACYKPELTVLVKTADNAAALSAAVPFTESCRPSENKTAFYLCRDGVCSAPVSL